MQDELTIGGLLDDVRNASDGDKTSVGDIVQSLGEQSLTPNLIFVALAVASPLSGIPAFSSVCGIAIALISAQLLIGRDCLWLPDFVKRRQLDSGKLDRALDFLDRPAAWLDRVTKPRLRWLVKGPVRKLTQLFCLLAGLLMPVLELVPFTSSTLGITVSLLAFGMLARDGLFTALGLAVLLALGGGAVWLLR